MKTLIFSDIHASANSCLEIEALLGKYDRVVCCGDVVGYGRDPEACIDFIRTNKIPTVKGNHDAMVVGEEAISEHPVVRESILWTQQRLSAGYKDFLCSLPQHIDLGDLYLSHTLGGRYIYSAQDINASIEEILRAIDSDRVAIGHSHVPFCLNVAGKLLANPSSITKGRKGHPRGYMIFDGNNFDFVSLGEARL